MESLRQTIEEQCENFCRMNLTHTIHIVEKARGELKQFEAGYIPPTIITDPQNCPEHDFEFYLQKQFDHVHVLLNENQRLAAEKLLKYDLFSMTIPTPKIGQLWIRCRCLILPNFHEDFEKLNITGTSTNPHGWTYEEFCKKFL